MLWGLSYSGEVSFHESILFNEGVALGEWNRGME